MTLHAAPLHVMTAAHQPHRPLPGGEDASQVNGIILEALFARGADDVKAGRLLYRSIPPSIRQPSASAKSQCGQGHGRPNKQSAVSRRSAIRAGEGQNHQPSRTDAPTPAWKARLPGSPPKAALQACRRSTWPIRPSPPLSAAASAKSAVTEGATDDHQQADSLTLHPRSSSMYVDVRPVHHSLLAPQATGRCRQADPGSAGCAKGRPSWEMAVGTGEQGTVAVLRRDGGRTTGMVTLRVLVPAPLINCFCPACSCAPPARGERPQRAYWCRRPP